MRLCRATPASPPVDPRRQDHCRSDADADSDADAELLRKFVERRDELAFEAIVARHAGLVMGVCRRAVGHAQDAEDAFQATFLVLARKVPSIRRSSALASWLYKTAHRIALQARRRRARRVEKFLESPMEVVDSKTLDSIAHAFDSSVLEDELARLPERYRLPLLLCCVEGNTREQAARQLGWSLGSLKGRLERARTILCSRLLRRGVSAAVVLAMIHMSCRTAQTAVPGALIVSTAQAAANYASGHAAVGYVSQNALTLAHGALNTMYYWHWKALVGILLLGGFVSLTADSASPAKERTGHWTNLTIADLPMDDLRVADTIAAETLTIYVTAPAAENDADSIDETPPKRESDPSPSDKTPPAADVEAEIQSLLQQIRSAKYSEREAATRELRRIGKPAIPALQKALTSDAPEVRVRAQSLLYHILPETRPRASLVIDSVNTNQTASIPAGTYKEVLIVDVNGNAVISSDAIRADELRVGSVNGTAKFVLRGTAKKLSIGYINGACEIDASGLAADDIEIGEVNGASKISLRSNGDVRFAGNLDGSTRLDVSADGDVTVGKGVGGGVRLNVLASKDFALAGDIGEGVQIDVKHSGNVNGVGPGHNNVRTTRIDTAQ